MSLRPGWRHLKKAEACPICGRGGDPRNRNTHCTLTDDGAVVCCQKSGGLSCGGLAPFKTTKNGGALYRIREREGGSAPAYTVTPARQPRRPNFNRLFGGWWRAVRPDALAALAASLGVSPDALRRLEIGWAEAARDLKTGRALITGTPTFCRLPGTWVFPMRDEAGEICGARIRTGSGAKYSVDGSVNGLFVPTGLQVRDTLLFPEGPTNPSALLSIGANNVIGRPNNGSGVIQLVGYIRRMKPARVVLIGDNDERYNEHLGRMQWPGREGAERVIEGLATHGIAASLVFPPRAFKDVRDWVRGGATAAHLPQLISSTGRAA